MIALLRTAVVPDKKHAGLSQFLVDLKSPGITIRPIIDLAGEHDFNEVVFDDVLRARRTCVVGAEGEGWKQVTTELAFERSGPERYLSAASALLLELMRDGGTSPTSRAGRRARPPGRAPGDAAPDVAVGRRHAPGAARTRTSRRRW